MKDSKFILELEAFRKEKALKLLFKPKQIEIIRKVMKLQKLSKRENEVYSRTIKPKMNAIIDFYETAIVVRSKF